MKTYPLRKNDTFKLLAEKVEANNYTNDYASAVAETVGFFRTVVSHDKTLIGGLRRMVRERVVFDTSAKLFYQDLIDVIKTDKMISFEKYTYALVEQQKRNYTIPLDLVLPSTSSIEVTLEDELDIIFKKVGLKGAILILRLIGTWYHD